MREVDDRQDEKDSEGCKVGSRAALVKTALDPFSSRSHHSFAYYFTHLAHSFHQSDTRTCLSPPILHSVKSYCCHDREKGTMSTKSPHLG